MSILSDKEIKKYATEQEMISPFEEISVKEKDGKKVLSYGLSSYGYDISLGNEFFLFTNTDPFNPKVVDPKKLRQDTFIKINTTDPLIIPPHSFVLGVSKEYIKMPPDVTAVVVGKSTYARAGIQTLCTPLEAGWEGQITLEFFNHNNHPVIMYPGEGCVQALFFKGDVPCEVSYSDRNGKYQYQVGVTAGMC